MRVYARKLYPNLIYITKKKEEVLLYYTYIQDKYSYILYNSTYIVLDYLICFTRSRDALLCGVCWSLQD